MTGDCEAAALYAGMGVGRIGEILPPRGHPGRRERLEAGRSDSP
jgi:hypothetical protein